MIKQGWEKLLTDFPRYGKANPYRILAYSEMMPGHKIGRLWKFDKKEVDAWVKSGAAAERDDQDPNATKDRSK